jgi:two-component system, NarL family, nitrate/nitrite response regulator NarL
MSVTQILVVDDFVPWLGVVHGILESETDLKIIAATTDGLEAIQTAKELQPDLILIDINLPSLNGFEVARRIRALSPASKILFLSDQRNPEMIDAAFRLGALGYVSKLDSNSDLVSGIRVVLRGQHFVSRSLKNWHSVTD